MSGDAAREGAASPAALKGSAEMAFREGTAGAGLQVFFEPHRIVNVGEFDRDQQLPRPMLRAVRG